MFVDSHCHLDRIKLTEYQEQFSQLLESTQSEGVSHMLCVAIDLESYPNMLALVQDVPSIFISVGVHPTAQVAQEPEIEQLVALAQHEKNVAIGETGLDYYRLEGDLSWQRERFAVHIEAAKLSKKPLIVHTRMAREDTLALLKSHQADQVGGVLHCFTENWAMGKAALDLGFYLSFSGIITFKSAADLRDVVLRTPIDRLLIETDSPYLAPVPFRGKQNQPKYVRWVAEQVAQIKGLDVETVAAHSKDNFFRLFKSASPR